MVNEIVNAVSTSLSEPLSDGKVARIARNCPQENTEDVNPFLVFGLAFNKVADPVGEIW
jgi:hypothetical protein